MTKTQLNIGLIGLGVMGQRMLTRLAGHARLRAVRVWDANQQALAQTLQAWPGLRAASSAESLISEPGLHSLYIATPPAAHLALSKLAFDAGLAVFCEKPLTVDFPAARTTIARIEREKRRAAVNFSLASSAGLAMLQRTFGVASKLPLGQLKSVDLELAFAAWPRPWQAGAGAWLSERGEGGFGREVLSHFVFALQRVLGPATVQSSWVEYPADGRSAETGLKAVLDASGVPVRIWGSVSGSLADYNRMSWQSSEGELELSEWFGQARQRRSPADVWQALGQTEAWRAAAQSDQLDQWVAMMEGRSHSLPGYAEALAAQETIEAILAGKAADR